MGVLDYLQSNFVVKIGWFLMAQIVLWLEQLD